MAWQPLPTTLSLVSSEKAINIEQYQSLAGGTDKIGFKILQEGELLTGSIFRVQDPSGNWQDLTGGVFWTTTPGEYLVKLISVSSENIVLQQVNKQIRITNSFRRYVIPDSHVCLDINKPWGYDGFGDPMIQVLNGYYDADTSVWVYEDIILTMLHPEDIGSRSDVGIFAQIDGSDGEVLQSNNSPAGSMYGSGYQTLKLRFAISGGTWDIDSLTGDEYQDIDVHTGLAFGAAADKFFMSNVPRDFKVRVWKQFASNRAASTMAIMPDADVRALLESIPTFQQYRFRGRVRTMGAVGTVAASNPEHLDGAWVDVSNVADYLAFTLTTYDNYTSSYSSGVALSVDTPATVTGFVPADIPLTQPVDAVVNQVHTAPPDFGPAEYHWMSIRLDKDARYLLHILPLAIVPTDIPVVAGFQSLIPLDIVIEDTINPSSTADYALGPIFMGFKEEYTAWGIYDPEASTFKKERMFSSRSGNPLKMGTTYRMWLRVPAMPSAAPSILYFNGVDFVTFSTVACNLSDTSDSNFFRNISKWVALGNFTHLIDASNPLDTSLHRAAYITNHFKQYQLDVGMAENVGGYAFSGIVNLTNSSVNCGYHLGVGNWQGAVDDWFSKMSNFITSDGFGWLADNGSQLPSADIANLTNEGLDLGLPFGLHTAYYTGSSQFDVNRNIVSFVASYYWLNLIVPEDGNEIPLNYSLITDGASNSEKLSGCVCVAKSWEGDYYRCVWVAVGPPERMIPDEGQIDLGLGVITNTTPLPLDSTLLNYDAGSPEFAAMLYLHAGPLNIVEVFTDLDVAFADVVWFDFAVNSYGDFGYGADKTGDRPYLITPDKLVTYDPLTVSETSITNATFTASESYDNNQVIVGQFSGAQAGFVAFKGAALIHRGHTILSRRTDGTLIHGYGAA